MPQFRGRVALERSVDPFLLTSDVLSFHLATRNIQLKNVITALLRVSEIHCLVEELVDESKIVPHLDARKRE